MDESLIIAWAYRHAGLRPMTHALSSQRPTAENLHFAALGTNPASLQVMPVGFIANEVQAERLGKLWYICRGWAWKSDLMKGWAIGHKPPDPNSTHYRRHPEEFSALTIRPLFSFSTIKDFP
jgi:hypothetical protein